MNGYIAFYEHKRAEIYAETIYEAKLKAFELFRVPQSKKTKVHVELAELGGKQVTTTITNPHRKRRRKNPRDLHVPKEILRQLKTMAPVALMAWGYNSPTGDENSLTFKVNGMKSGHAFVSIILAPRDTYTVEVFKVRMGKRTNIARVEDVYVDDLVDTIDHIIER